MSLLVSIIGDANVRRNMTGLNVASRETMKNAQIIDFLGLSPVDQALNEVRAESTICIFAAITDPIVANGDCGTIFASIDPVLNSLHAAISAYCSAHPNLQVRTDSLRQVCFFFVYVVGNLEPMTFLISHDIDIASQPLSQDMPGLEPLITTQGLGLWVVA